MSCRTMHTVHIRMRGNYVKHLRNMCTLCPHLSSQAIGRAMTFHKDRRRIRFQSTVPRVRRIEIMNNASLKNFGRACMQQVYTYVMPAAIVLCCFHTPDENIETTFMHVHNHNPRYQLSYIYAEHAITFTNTPVKEADDQKTSSGLHNPMPPQSTV